MGPRKLSGQAHDGRAVEPRLRLGRHGHLRGSAPARFATGPGATRAGRQVRNAGEVFCGSQELEPGEGWPYDRILKALAAKPAMDATALASMIAKEFVNSYPANELVTQSAFTLAGVAAVQAETNALGVLMTISWHRALGRVRTYRLAESCVE